MKVTRTTFEKLASDIVRRTYGSGDLSEAVAKTAMDLSLNPESIKTLLHMVNTIASLKHLDEASDRSEAFPLAEPSKVLRIVFKMDGETQDEDAMTGSGHVGGAGCSTGCGHQQEEPVADEHEDYAEAPSGDNTIHHEDLPTVTDEVKEAASNASLPLYMPLDEDKTARIHTEHAINKFKTQRAQVESEYVDHTLKLATLFKRYHGPSWAEFEKNAFSLHGEPCTEPLLTLRKALGYPGLLEHTAKEGEYRRLVDSSSPQQVKLARMLELNAMHTVLNDAVDKLEVRLTLLGG